jgi:hypothetical protein
MPELIPTPEDVPSTLNHRFSIGDIVNVAGYAAVVLVAPIPELVPVEGTNDAWHVLQTTVVWPDPEVYEVAFCTDGERTAAICVDPMAQRFETYA